MLSPCLPPNEMCATVPETQSSPTGYRSPVPLSPTVPLHSPVFETGSNFSPVGSGHGSPARLPHPFDPALASQLAALNSQKGTKPTHFSPDLREQSRENMKRMSAHYRRCATKLNEFCDSKERHDMLLHIASSNMTRNERAYTDAQKWQQLIRNLLHDDSMSSAEHHQISVEALTRTATAKLEEWRSSSSGTPFVTGQSLPDGQCEVFAHSVKGKRRRNEDAVLNLPSLSVFHSLPRRQSTITSLPSSSSSSSSSSSLSCSSSTNHCPTIVNDPICGVFDGHGGDEAAIYCQKYLPMLLVSAADFPSDKAFQRAFGECHESFNLKADAMECDAGTTAMIAYFNRGEVTLAHVGDCQAVLCTDGKATVLSTKHTADNADEAKAISERGGAIVHFGGAWRVNGMLNVTRSIGDRPCRDCLSAVPDVIYHSVRFGQDEFLILATDGLWDVIEPQAACDFVRQARSEVDAFRLQNQNATGAPPSPSTDKSPGEEEEDGSPGIEDYQLVVEALIAEAEEQGSTDNISAVILFFYPPPASVPSSEES